MTRSLTAALFFALCMLCALGTGCSDDDEESAPSVTRTEPARVGQRGESCRARNDCEEGLACLNNVCVLNDFNIEATAKSCEIIECTSNDDCCGEQDGFCDELDQDCRNGNEFACEDFNQFCACNFVCNADNLCEPTNTCESDFECGGGSCVAGKCVECGSDEDCFGDDRCIQNSCISPCQGNNDCPYFSQCNGGTCQEVGCTTNRECIAFTGNPQASCVGSECVVPCQSDAECAGIGDGFGGFNFLACVDSRCTYVGCETDEECRIYLGVGFGASETAVCR